MKNKPNKQINKESWEKTYKYLTELPFEFKSMFEAIKKRTGKSYNYQAYEAFKEYFRVNTKKGD